MMVLKEFLQSHHLEESVKLHGKIPTVTCIRSWRITLLVSTSEGEPYGRNVAEAMSVGTPVIAHASGGPADLIRSGEDGIL